MNSETSIPQQESGEMPLFSVLPPQIAEHTLFTPEGWNDCAETFMVLTQSMREATALGVPENTVAARAELVLLADGYATDAFVGMTALRDGEVPDERSIFTTVRDKYDAWSNGYTRDTPRTIAKALMGYTGRADQSAHFLVGLLAQLPGEKVQMYKMQSFFEMPLEPDDTGVSLWRDVSADSTRQIAIAGHDRTGVAGVRRIIREMRDLRSQRWTGWDRLFAKDEIISCDSWIFARPENIPLVLGESREELTEKGLQWLGPTDIRRAGDMDEARLTPVTYFGRTMAAAVYALPLRDPFIRNFVTRGEYPPVGSFIMPRETFQNLSV